MVKRTNYLYVKEYLKYREEVEQISPSSLGRYWSYLRHLLLWADETLFSFVHKIRPTFTVYVSELVNPSNNQSLAWTTKKKIIETARHFFKWLKDSSPTKFKSTTKQLIDTLRPPRCAQNVGEHEFVSLKEVIHLINVSNPETNLAMQRDKAAAAMLYLSGMRATAFTTLPICGVDLASKSIRQWPELGVETKNGKKATTYLLPIPELLAVVKEWDDLVRKELPLDARWYAPILSEWGEQSLSLNAPGKNRSQALGKRLRLLFDAAGIKYRSPHKFRHGNAVYGLQHAVTMADYKAVSMNLMHNDIKTTDSIYARLLSDDVGQRIAGLTDSSTAQPDTEIVEIFKSMSNDQLLQIIQHALTDVTP